MEAISFATSVREWRLNDACTVIFSPTDGFFAKKLFCVFSALAEKQDDYEKQATSALSGADKIKVFELAEARDAEMRGMLNDVFGVDVCTPLFPDRSVYSLAEGFPEWCNLLLAVMDKMDETLVAEQKAADPRVQKYTQKYSKYQKYHK